jgi:hypothetical protein
MTFRIRCAHPADMARLRLFNWPWVGIECGWCHQLFRVWPLR